MASFRNFSNKEDVGSLIFPALDFFLSFCGNGKKRNHDYFFLLLFLPKQKKSNHHVVAAKLKTAFQLS